MDNRASKAQALVPRQSSLLLHGADQHVLSVPSWAVLRLVAPSCLTLCHPMDCSPGASVHGILQARILEWAAMLSTRGSSRPRDWTQVSLVAGGFFTIWATRKPMGLLNLTQYLHVWLPCQTESSLRLWTLSGYLYLLLLFSL